MAMARESGIKKISPDDPRFEEVVTQWLQEIDEVSNHSELEESDAECEQSNHDSHSDISGSEQEEMEDQTNVSESQDEEMEEQTVRNTKAYYGKGNRFKWSKLCPARTTRTPAHNIIKKLPGCIGKARSLSESATEEAFWNCIFTEEMLAELLLHTNSKIQAERPKYSTQNQHIVQNLDMIELKSFIGLLFFTGAFKSGHEDATSLFSTDGTGRDICRATMTVKRFLFVLSCLRFDNAQDRTERYITDPVTPVSYFFTELVSNSQKSFTPGDFMCIDEMLVPFRGRCKYKMYLPNKPAKYGLKVMVLADVATHYFYNGYVYCGKDSDGIGLPDNLKNFSKPTQAVLRLVTPVEGSRRNIKADNWFSSVPLVLELRKRGLTYIGTMRKSQKDIPYEFLPNRQKTVGTSQYGFVKDMTLLSFVPKRNKAVILISSMHHSNDIDPESGKPEIISQYNRTKGGVDALDQKCANYSVSRRTRRWPMAIFAAILNISAINAHVLCYSKKCERADRLTFLKNLSMQLVMPQLMRRLHNNKLPTELRSTIGRILKKEVPSKGTPGDENVLVLGIRKRCYICPSKMNRKTFQLCHDCKKPICSGCTTRICKQCAGNERQN